MTGKLPRKPCVHSRKGVALEWSIKTGEFGGVYDFMGVNSVTTDLSNYADAHHFTPRIGKAIANRLEGRIDGLSPTFGVFVTAQNVEKHFTVIAMSASIADPNPISTFTVRLSKQRP